VFMIRKTIFTKYGRNVGREMIRDVMQDVDPEAFVFRRPGHKIGVRPQCSHARYRPTCIVIL
jgi:hypothetical protein